MRALSRAAPTIVLAAFCSAVAYLAIENYSTARAQIEPSPGDVAPPPNAVPRFSAIPEDAFLCSRYK
jgi:hypothetical protein